MENDSPVFSKLFEYAFDLLLKEYLNKNKIVTNTRFSFFEGKSACDAIHLFIKNVVDSVDYGISATSVFCDLSSVFDCVNHTKLTQKLSACGNRVLALEWLDCSLETGVIIYRVLVLKIVWVII